MITVNIHEMKAKLSHYLALAEQGEKVVICRRNVPVAELAPLTDVPPEGKRRIGGYPELLNIPDSAFFEPLPDDLQQYFDDPEIEPKPE